MKTIWRTTIGLHTPRARRRPCCYPCCYHAWQSTTKLGGQRVKTTSHALCISFLNGHAGCRDDEAYNKRKKERNLQEGHFGWRNGCCKGKWTLRVCNLCRLQLMPIIKDVKPRGHIPLLGADGLNCPSVTCRCVGRIHVALKTRLARGPGIQRFKISAFTYNWSSRLTMGGSNIRNPKMLPTLSGLAPPHNMLWKAVVLIQQDQDSRTRRILNIDLNKEIG